MAGKSYDERKEQVSGILREQSRKGRDIGPLPPIVDAFRRESCRHSFKLFCETYFAAVFQLEWSEDHLTVIEIIQAAVLNGGLFAVAMPRGSGKTSLVLAACVWAISYGHCKYVVLIGATEDHAARLLKNVVVDLETNDLLLADFPEICYPIRRLEHISKRIQGQMLEGQPTRMSWTAKEFVLPTVPDSITSGSRIQAVGITGSIRGMTAKLVDGTTIRPDFALIDDPQTRESAQSDKQNRDRMETVNGDILGLAGPAEKISAVMPCTVIQKGDMADQALDRMKAPSWQGVRTKLLKTMPTNSKLWEEYAEIWSHSLRTTGTITAATEWYEARRDDLNEGAEASWAERYNDDEASAIQNAMNLKLRDEVSFAAEYQNDPLSVDIITPLLLTTEQVAAKAIAGIARGVVPRSTTKLVTFVDVQATILFYAVLAVGEDFTSHVVEYGTYPEQQRSHFFLREVSPTLADVHRGISAEGQIRAGLDAIASRLLERNFQCDDGRLKQIDRFMVDAGNWTELIKQFARESRYKSRIITTKGYGIGPEKAAIDDWNFKVGDRRGFGWLYRRESDLLHIDVNQWKTFLAERLRMAVGETGNMSLHSGSLQQHKMFAQHVTSENVIPVTANGRTVNVWRVKPTSENHWLDCLCGALVAASEQGILFVGHQAQIGNRPKRKGRKLLIGNN